MTNPDPRPDLPHRLPACRAGTIRQVLNRHKEAVAGLDDAALETLGRMAEILIETFQAGRFVYVCGNGGSAADAQHIAAELVGRFRPGRDRRPLPCIAVTTDSSVLTAVGNDFGFEQVFARQLEALAREGDVLWALSTSGASSNVLAAARMMRRRGGRVLAMTGPASAGLAELAEVCFRAPASPPTCIGGEAGLIQEIHQVAYHILCELLDEHFACPPARGRQA